MGQCAAKWCTDSKTDFGVPGEGIDVPPLPPRPVDAVGTFLRAITINDVYVLKNYPAVATCVEIAKKAAAELDCVVTSHNNGDFLSPCLDTALDGGKAMVHGLNMAKIGYVCLGNHEFDMGFDVLVEQMQAYTGKCINSNVEDAKFATFPRYDLVSIGSKTAVIGGYCTGDPNIYVNPKPTMSPILQAMDKTWIAAKAKLGKKPDLFLPMTHDFLEEDHKTAKGLAGHPELRNCTPVILGGHEHEEFYEEEGNALIVKTGQDANTIGIVDIYWTADGSIKRSFNKIQAASFSRQSEAAKFVDAQETHLNAMMSVPICQLDEPKSSTEVRFMADTMPTYLNDIIKAGLKSEGVQLVMISAGCNRGRAKYEPGDFTMGNLYAEHPWDTELAIVKIPGDVIAHTIKHSRTYQDGQKPLFMQCDKDAMFDNDQNIVAIDGKSFEPKTNYTCAVLHVLLMGMDGCKLKEWVDTVGFKIPDIEACKHSKHIILRFLMRMAWRQLLDLHNADIDGDGSISKEELRSAVNKAIAALDANGDGTVTTEECEAYLRKKKCFLLEHMIAGLDLDGSGIVSRSEIESLVV